MVTLTPGFCYTSIATAPRAAAGNVRAIHILTLPFLKQRFCFALTRRTHLALRLGYKRVERGPLHNGQCVRDDARHNDSGGSVQPKRCDTPWTLDMPCCRSEGQSLLVRQA
jgi:hypothetical protein